MYGNCVNEENLTHYPLFCTMKSGSLVAVYSVAVKVEAACFSTRCCPLPENTVSQLRSLQFEYCRDNLSSY